MTTLPNLCRHCGWLVGGLCAQLRCVPGPHPTCEFCVDLRRHPLPAVVRVVQTVPKKWTEAQTRAQAMVSLAARGERGASCQAVLDLYVKPAEEP